LRADAAVHRCPRSALREGLYVEDGNERLLWIHADLIGVEREFVLDVRRLLEKELGLGPAHVMISATHTHSGPATIHLQEAARTIRPMSSHFATESSIRPV